MNGSQGQCPPVPCGTEGKPDFPLKVRPNSFFVCFPVTRFSKKEFAFGRNTHFGVNHGSRAVIGDLCETQTAECGVSRKRVIGVSLLFELIARGENRLFSPEKVRPICFCGTSLCSCPLSPFRFFLPPTAGERVILSFVDSLQHKSFAASERRLQSKNKSRLAAGDAPVQVASLSVFGNYKKFLVIFYT